MNGSKIGFLGPDGTYSSIGARALCPSGELIAYPTFFTLFKALETGEVEGIVLPIENSLNGAVTQNLDLMQEAEGVYAKASLQVKIEHRLVSLKGADKGKIERIFSHPQALAQCSKFLAENYPDARLYQTASTAESLERIVCPTDAGIVGAHCGKEGYELDDRCISDVANNFTQFLLAVKGKPSENDQSSRLFFSVTCFHRSGALFDMLGVLKDGNVNMTKIESRPIKDMAGEFRFFIEAEGNYALPEVRATLTRLRQTSHSMKLLGVY